MVSIKRTFTQTCVVQVQIVQYKIVSEEGPDHDKIFTVEVNINSNSVATGKGKSKKIAEQMAAKKLLRLMGE